MRIGLTYDLRADYLAAGFGDEETAEFDRPDTIEAIESAIQVCGHETVRIGTVNALIAAVATGQHWDLVFNIAEGLYGIAREAQVPAVLDVYQIPYTFSDPLVMALTLHKGMTKHVVRDLGLPTPEFVVVETERDIDRIDLPFPLFAKPIAEGTGKGITGTSKLRSLVELGAVCRRLLSHYRQPVLVETFLPGREFTVAVVGTGDQARVLGTVEVVLRPNAEADAYSYVNKEKCEELVLYELVHGAIAEEAAELSLAAWRGLNCRDAGRIDVRADSNGRLSFMEVNPLPGLHPEHSDLPIICTKAGISYQVLIAKILESAIQRTNTISKDCGIPNPHLPYPPRKEPSRVVSV